MLAPVEGGRVQVELQDILARGRRLWDGRGAFSRVLAYASAVVGIRVTGRGTLRLARTGDERADHHARRRLSRRALRRAVRVQRARWIRRCIRDPAIPQPAGRSDARASRTTWAERAWLLIGAYWIVLGVFVIPARLHDFKLADVVLFGLAPVVVAIGPACARAGDP